MHLFFFNIVSGVTAIRKVIVPVILCFSLFFSTSCNKTDSLNGTPSSIIMYNAMQDGIGLYVIPKAERPDVFGTSQYLSNQSFYMENKLFIDKPVITIAAYSRADTLPSDAPLLKWEQPVATGTANSLFFAGTKANPEYVFTKDVFLKPGADSVAYIRFINLSGVSALSINIKDSAQGSTIASLNYKSVSAFLAFPANTETKSYVFEIRNKITGDLFATYSTPDLITPWMPSEPLKFLRKHTSLIITGQQGAASPNQPRVGEIHHMIN